MADEQERFFLCFLMILVQRNGGKLEIDNLSDFGSKKVSLGMEMQPGNNSVILTTVEISDEQDKKINWN